MQGHWPSLIQMIFWSNIETLIKFIYSHAKSITGCVWWCENKKVYSILQRLSPHKPFLFMKNTEQGPSSHKLGHNGKVLKQNSTTGKYSWQPEHKRQTKFRPLRMTQSKEKRWEKRKEKFFCFPQIFTLNMHWAQPVHISPPSTLGHTLNRVSL